MNKGNNPVRRTPCGYPPGSLRASDGTQYEVLLSGQIVRRDGGKMGKAERKAAKRNKVHRLEKHKVHRLEACATGLEACATGLEACATEGAKN